MARELFLRLAIVAALLLAVFVIAQQARIPVLSDPRPLLDGHKAVAAAVSFGLLAGDILLPVPSSLVMLANGAVFGIIPGAILSIAGSLSAAMAGFWLGRRGRRGRAG
ncbi:MAG: hypothetical protein ACRD44_06805, partial [Bryobacteraceae bacterium]